MASLTIADLQGKNADLEKQVEGIKDAFTRIQGMIQYNNALIEELKAKDSESSKKEKKKK